MKSRILVNTFGVGTLALLLGTSSPWAAQSAAPAHRQLERRKPVQGVIDVLNLFPQVGVLLVVGAPNDVGFPVGIVAFCSGTLIHERAFLTAGHFTGPASFAPLPPFIKAFVSLSPNALDPSTWRPVVEQITHPSIPPCPPPLGCDPTTQDVFHALDPGISDIGLAFLAQPVHGIRPARLSEVDALESRTAGRLPMIFVVTGSHSSVLAAKSRRRPSGRGGAGLRRPDWIGSSTIRGPRGSFRVRYVSAIRAAPRSLTRTRLPGPWTFHSSRSQAMAASTASVRTTGLELIPPRSSGGFARQFSNTCQPSIDVVIRAPRVERRDACSTNRRRACVVSSHLH